MKKFIVALFISLFLAMPALAINLGVDITKTAADKAGYSKDTSVTTFSQTIGVVINAALAMVGAIFLALTVYAGYLWMTARGESEQIAKAQKIISSSIIGLILVVAAYSITTFVVPKITASTLQAGQ